MREVTNGSARWVWQLIVLGVLTWQKVFRGREHERRYNESRLSTDNSKRTPAQERRQGVAISTEEVMEYYVFNGSQGWGDFGAWPHVKGGTSSADDAMNIGVSSGEGESEQSEQEWGKKERAERAGVGKERASRASRTGERKTSSSAGYAR